MPNLALKKCVIATVIALIDGLCAVAALIAVMAVRLA